MFNPQDQTFDSLISQIVILETATNGVVVNLVQTAMTLKIEYTYYEYF